MSACAAWPVLPPDAAARPPRLSSPPPGMHRGSCCVPTPCVLRRTATAAERAAPAVQDGRERARWTVLSTHCTGRADPPPDAVRPAHVRLVRASAQSAWSAASPAYCCRYLQAYRPRLQVPARWRGRTAASRPAPPLGRQREHRGEVRPGLAVLDERPRRRSRTRRAPRHAGPGPRRPAASLSRRASPAAHGHPRPASGAPAAVRAISASRRSSACAAHSSSIARICSTCPSTVRAWRAAVAPIETWSSWFALVGIESADDGCASTLFSDARAAAVYWTIIRPLFRPGSGVRNAGRPPLSRGSTSSAVRRSRDRAQLGQRELREVERERDRLAVEVAAADDEPAARREGIGRDRAALREHERVVGRGVELDVEHAPQVVERVADRAVDLRHAAQRVRVLDLVRRPVVRGLEAGIAQEVPQLARPPRPGRGAAARAGRAPRTRPRCRGAPRRSSPRRRSRCASGGPRRRAAARRAPLISWVPLRSARPSFGPRVSGSSPRLPERDSAGQHLAVQLHLAAPDERQREVGERREVAGRADAALLRHDRDGCPARGARRSGPRPAAGNPSARARGCSPAAAASPGRPRAGTARRRPPRATRAGSPGAALRHRAG